MSGQYLRCGAGVLREKRVSGTKVSDAADKIVADALDNCQKTELPVRYALLLATADWCTGRCTLPRDVRSALEKRLHYKVPLLGGSMAKVFCSSDPGGFIDPGVLLVLFCSEDLWVTVGYLKKPYNSNGEPDVPALRRFAKEFDETTNIRLGWSAERYIFGMFPGFLGSGEGRKLYDSELYFKLLIAFGHQYQIVGASAADKLRPTTGYQFADDKCLQSGLAIAMVESDLATGIGMRQGYQPHEKKRCTVTKLVGGKDTSYEIETLDGIPAARHLQELKRDLKLEGETLLVLGLHSGADYKIIVPIDPPAEGDGPIRLNRKVAVGDCFYVMVRKPVSGWQNVHQTMQSALAASHGTIREAGLFLGFGCTGLFTSRSKEGVAGGKLVDWLKSQSSKALVVGGLCAGEFGSDPLYGSGPMNMSLWVRCWLDRYASRARPLRLQSALMRAAGRLSACESPGAVMKQAIEEAVRAGAEGGQICLLDEHLKLILGDGFGYASPRSKRGHDWQAVAKRSFRKAPEIVGGDFPVDLREWSMAVADLTLRFSPAIPHEEDILTLVSRTRRAVFVLDQRDPRFCCDPKVTPIGGFQTHLDIPLLGSGLRVIGTMQVSFPNGTILDRESFALWVGYSQKVASTLEREQEKEEREIRGKILESGNLILREPPDIRPGRRYAWCDRFLGVVAESLGAEATHMRVLKGEGLHLIGSAPDGPLSKLRWLTRPVTRPGEHGACDRATLERGGFFYDRKAQMPVFESHVTAVLDAEKYGSALCEELAKINATAILPLFDHNQLIGTWVIDSYRERFFTERWLRIIRAAGDFLGAMFRLKESDYYRAVMLDYRNRLQQDAGLVEPKQSLVNVIQLLCEITRADWGALFIWYEGQEELILQASYNWLKPMEGTASYKMGEGWTGRLATSETPIKFLAHMESSGGLEPAEKYRSSIEPPELISSARTSRIGLKLTAGDVLVGVVTLGYYPNNTARPDSLDAPTLGVLEEARKELALSVGGVRANAARQRQDELRSAKGDLASLLADVSKPDGLWQPVLDRLFAAFPGGRAALYLVSDGEVTLRCVAPSAALSYDLEPFKLADYPALKDLAEADPKGNSTLLVKEPDARELRHWPNAEGVRDLLAAPAFSPEGRVCGVLEFVNRVRNDPFAMFDDMDKRAAWDIAQTLGAVISLLDHHRALTELMGRFATAMRIAAAGLFGAHVIHEMMSPFVEIQRAVDRLRRLSGEDPEVQYCRIEAQKARALAIIDAVRMRGIPGARVEEVRATVRDAVRVIRPSIPASGLSLEVRNECTERVRVDHMSVVSALVNLLNNALDALNGKGKLTIESAREPETGKVVIRVYNSGVVLPPEEIARFSRSGYSSKGGQHFGLGVALARQSIEAADGTLEFSSPPQGGVEAVITLPICTEVPHGDAEHTAG